MKKYIFVVVVALLYSLPNSYSQYISDVTTPDTSPPIVDPEDASYFLGQTITAGDMKQHLSILASDEYEGRETGQPGNYKAAEYIANHFETLGMPTIGDDYFQDVKFTWESWNDISITVNENEYKHLWDFLAFQNKNQDWDQVSIDEIYFLGYGIDDEEYSDYDKIGDKIKGKSIIIYEGEPRKDGVSYITGSQDSSEWTTNWEKKLEAAKEHGVASVFIISNNIKKMLADNRRILLGSKPRLGEIPEAEKYPANFFISTTIAKDIVGKKLKKMIRKRDRILKKGKPKNFSIDTNIDFVADKNVVELAGYNVMGFIEGTDLKDELVIMTAHYDHLGKRGESIYNGADDNGSGTTTILEISEAFMEGVKKGIKPRRSILFLLVTGEEKGLLGSSFYVNNPVFPLDMTMVNINVDMVGRVDEKYAENPRYIYVIGSDRLSSELHEINEKVNQDYEQLVLDYTYNSETDRNRYYYRSDHYNFAKNGIPAIFFFNGTHPDYHQTTDTVEKINFEKMAIIGRHIFHLAFDLANRDEAIKVDGVIKS